MLEAKAVIPDLMSSLSLGGGEGDAVRVKLDIYLDPDELPKLAELRGQELLITLGRCD